MKLEIKVVPRAKQTKVVTQNNVLKVYTTQPAIDGRANEAVIAILAGHFAIPKSKLEITKGLKSRNKTIIISL